jgi:hypothetical protein
MKKHRVTTVCLLIVALVCLPTAFTGHALAGRWQGQLLLLVANTAANNIVAYAQVSGQYLGEFISAGTGGLDHPDTMVIGPDGRLYISSGTIQSGTPQGNSAILRFDAETGAFLGVFASGGDLFRPYGMAFGPDGHLYVASFLTDQILRYHSITGAFVDEFARGNGQSGGLNGPNGLAFGPDGKLYVSTQGSVAINGVPTFPGLPSEVLRYDVRTGSSMVFLAQPDPSPDSFGFVSFLGVEFGPACDLDLPRQCDVFVSDFANDIRRYNLQGKLEAQLSTNYTGTSPSNNFVGGLTFGALRRLFTVGFNNVNPAMPGAILRYSGFTNAPLPGSGQPGAVYVPETSKLVRPIGILALPRPF